MIIKKWMIVVGLIIILCVSFFCGVLIINSINFSKKQEGNIAILAENQIDGESVDTSYVEETVSPNAIVVSTEVFKKCGHTICKKEDAPREIVNLNEEKVKVFYKGWNIDKFSSEEIQISRENPSICNEHYILGQSDGYISISVKNDIGEYIFKGLTNIPVQYLPEADIANLEYGIEIVGKDNLNSFLEDFE